MNIIFDLSIHLFHNCLSYLFMPTDTFPLFHFVRNLIPVNIFMPVLSKSLQGIMIIFRQGMFIFLRTCLIQRL